MNENDKDFNEILIFGAIFIIFGFTAIFFYSKSVDDFYKNTIDLVQADTVNLHVKTFYSDRGSFLFNGKYSSYDANLNYHTLNGRRFEWSELSPPFHLRKKSDSDTLILTKNYRKHYFKIENIPY